MAVQQNKKSPSRRNMRRMHDALSQPAAGDRARLAARSTCATTSALPATTAARKSSRPGKTEPVFRPRVSQPAPH